jgi:hypothetical protein
VFISAVWKLMIPRGFIFSCGFCQKTSFNLSKRGKLDDVTCLFCGEEESVHHLFFGSVVARRGG